MQQDNDFDFETWKEVEIGDVWRRGVDCVVSLSPLASRFCVLHAKLRVIGDSLKNKIIWQAVANKELTQVVAYIKAHISPQFKVEVTKKTGANGSSTTSIASSSLIGNKCDMFVSEQHYEQICRLAGISNEGVELEDRRDGEQHVCMSKLDGGMRCKTNRVATNKNQLCRRHIAMDADGGRVATVSNWKHNPQMWDTTTQAETVNTILLRQL